MRLDEFAIGDKIRRPSWKKSLYLVETLQGNWRYFEDGNMAGSPSREVLRYKDFEYYEKVVIMEDVNFVGGEYNVVKVKFIGRDASGGHYNYKIAADIPVEESVLVVVHSSNGLGLARVVTAYQNTFENALEVNKATAWVINVVDEQDHASRIKASEKRDYILKQLEERKSSFQAMQVYEAVGAVDPIAKKLLKQLKKLL